MPIYEYERKKCGNIMEVWQKFSDSPITKCESCKGKMRKLISQSSFHLKGSGWYVTDYASKDRGVQEKSAKSENESTTKKTKDASETPKKEASADKGKDTKSK